MMMDITREGQKKMGLAYTALGICKLKTKDNEKIREEAGFLTVDAVKNMIDELIRENYIKEEKDRYVLTDLGKSEIDKWETLKKRNIKFM
jgi:predicted transcriptional regulator